ncbi:hypothetical protein IGI49_004333 [Enterococcus sp. AZ071]
MTIKRRFFISYISAIIITLSAVLIVLSLAFYITSGTVPSVPQAYKMMTKQRPLTQTEEESYITLDKLVKRSPELLTLPMNSELSEAIHSIENKGLEVVIRKNASFPYYSKDLVEKSLIVHSPDYEMNNFMPTGTLDNAGRLYHYVKSDFQYLDGSKGSFIILKRESNLFEFITRWIIWVVIVIIIIAFLAAWYINKRLTKTTIEPLEDLEKASKKISDPTLTNNPFTTKDEQKLSSEVKQLQISFEQMWQDLQEANQQKELDEDSRKELIANISHDLKTPVTSILGYVEGLLDGVANTNEKRNHYLKVIHEKSIALNELIEELFFYSKLDLDQSLYELRLTNFVSFIQPILEEYLWEKDIELTTDIPDKKLLVNMDEIQMRRVITNLIQNSIKFAHSEKDVLKIFFSITYSSTELTLTITDNGIGVAEEELPYLFDRFYRTDKSRTPTIKGSGLGLSIAKQIIEHHQGSISIDSKHKTGTSVKIQLPLMKEAH